jgi:hypothetical protein
MAPFSDSEQFAHVMDQDLALRYQHTDEFTKQLARIPFPPAGPHALPTPIGAFAFDTTQELLWTANEYVRERDTQTRW